MMCPSLETAKPLPLIVRGTAPGCGACGVARAIASAMSEPARHSRERFWPSAICSGVIFFSSASIASRTGGGLYPCARARLNHM